MGRTDGIPRRTQIPEQLARDVVRDPDPESGLRALSALRQELDRLEPELVKRALNVGATWSKIATALDISKQAAHRKFRHLANEDLGFDTARHKILVTGEARRAVELGRITAKELGHSQLGTEHLLLGILRCEKSHAVLALNGLGVTYDGAIEMLRTTLPQAPAPEPHDSKDPSVAPISPQAGRILEGSLREALNRGDGYIGVEHLLLSLITDSRNGAVQTLEQFKVSPKQIRSALDRAWRDVSRSMLAGP